MPALPSFITYRPGKKAKAAIKAPFSLLRGENPTSSSTTAQQQQFIATDVIDINNSRYSLDFDGGKPLDSFEQDVFDHPQTSDLNLARGTSPQVELDIDLSSNGFSDWLDAFSGIDAKQEAQIAALRLSRLKNSVHINVKAEESKDGEGEANEEFASSLESALDASHLATLPGHDEGPPSSKHYDPSSITVPDSNSPISGQVSDSSISNIMAIRPLSLQSDITASSALSGTTLARALMSNSFILSVDGSSRYRSGLGPGLTRSDSTTLPHGELGSFTISYNDRFSVGPDAPPIPLNAEFLYEPPRISRSTKQDLRRRSSTGSLSPILPPETPSISSNTRPRSAIINADAEPDLQAPLPKTPKPSVSRSPLPSTPAPQQTMDETITPNSQSTTPLYFQEVAQHLPIDTQHVSQDFSTLSPDPSSDGHASPKELEGLLLNYYSIPDSPEFLVAGGSFRPIFSPISEESSSQLSPPTPYRSDRRDSQRNQPAGARSPLSGSLRVRGDSIISPRKDQRASPRPPNLFPVEEGAQSNVAPVSPTNPGDSSFYYTADDDPDAPLTPPQLSTIFNRQRSGSAPNPIKLVPDLTDISAYNIKISSLSGNVTPSAEGIMVSQEFPETPEAFSPMFSAGSRVSSEHGESHEQSPLPSTPMSAAILGRNSSHSNLAAQLLLNRASVRHSRQGSLSKIKTTITTARSGSPPKRIAEIVESPEAGSSTLSPPADDATTEEIPQLTPSEPSARHSDGSFSVDDTRSPSNIGQDPSDGSSMYTSSVDIDSASRTRMKSLPAIPITSPNVPVSPDDEPPPVSLPGTSMTPVVLAEPIVAPPSPTPSKLSILRGKLPPTLNIPKRTSVSGPEGPIAVNGGDQSGQNSPELQHGPPGGLMPTFSSSLPTQSSLVYKNESSQSRASDIFRATSLGSPPPYYSIVNEAFDNQSPNPPLAGVPAAFHWHGSDNTAGPSSAESMSRNLVRENSILGQRARVRPPLPAGPRRPSQQSVSSPGPARERRASVSSIASSSLVLDSRPRRSVRYNNAMPSPSFQDPTHKWRGYTMEVAKWTFTSAQLQAIVSRAIRQSAEASSIRLLRLEVLDNEIPGEMQRLTSQKMDIKMRYKTAARRRATILDSLYSSLSVFEDGYSTVRLIRQLDELKEIGQTLDRLAEEIHSVDQQINHLESLIQIHTSSALAIALRKLNSSFLKQVAENQVLRNQIQSLEAERDEAWRQAQNVANEYDQISDSISNPSKRSSRASAIRKSLRVSRAGLRTPSQRLSAGSGGGAPITNFGVSASVPPPVPPLPKRRPMPVDILTDSPMRSAAPLSTSAITPTSESRALAQAQDELYAMLGILIPEPSHHHRSRSESSPESPVGASHLASRETSCMRHSSLPGALSLAEAYNAMAADRNAVLATIDMLSATD